MAYYYPTDDELAFLGWFRFVRSAGGFDNSPDRFEGRIPYGDMDDMLEKLRLLGASPRSVPPSDAAVAASGDAVHSWPIRRFPAFENPGKVVVFGYAVIVVVEEAYIEITVCGTADGNVWQLTEADYEACLALEEQFLLLGWRP